MADVSPFAQAILSGMLSLIPPGKTIYSQTVLDKCDASCQATPVCSDPSLLCSIPKFSQDHFDLQIDLIKKESLSPTEREAYENEIRLSSFTRSESYEEGISRYLTIALAIENVTGKLSWRKIGVKCKSICSDSPFSNDCIRCKSSRPWMGSEKELATALVTIFNYESGFRRDVHSGIGPMARGDCKWIDVKTKKPAAPYAKGATPIRGSCRSVCLGQINIGSDIKFGYKAEDLVGLDLESTTRCAEVAGRMLAQARNRCSGPNVDYTGDWVAGMFGAYGSGGACAPIEGTGATLRRAQWPARRAGTFRKVFSTTPDLTDKVKVILGLNESSRPLAMGD